MVLIMFFDPKNEIQKIKQLRISKRKRNYSPRKSKLEPYRFNIMELHNAKASLLVIQDYLNTKHHCHAARSTIHSYIKKVSTYD